MAPSPAPTQGGAAAAVVAEAEQQPQQEEGSSKPPPAGRYQARHPFVAGALTGGIEILITFPFEFIKVSGRLWCALALVCLGCLSRRRSPIPAQCRGRQSHPTTNPPPKKQKQKQVQLQLQHQYKLSQAFINPFDCALYTIRTKGPLGLYKGLTPWIVFAFPRHVRDVCVRE